MFEYATLYDFGNGRPYKRDPKVAEFSPKILSREDAAASCGRGMEFESPEDAQKEKTLKSIENVK